jgi:hypothetical protein
MQNTGFFLQISIIFLFQTVPFAYPYIFASSSAAFLCSIFNYTLIIMFFNYNVFHSENGHSLSFSIHNYCGEWSVYLNVLLCVCAKDVDYGCMLLYMWMCEIVVYGGSCLALWAERN